jgi:oligopeptide/dipeptide ABC transporter ATP-binding protein
MYAGYLVERGTAKEVYGDPRHPYTIGLLGSLPRLDRKGDKLFSIEGTPPDMRFLPPGCPFAARCPWVKDVCLEKNPLLEPVQDSSPDHTMACWVDVRQEEGGYERDRV